MCKQTIKLNGLLIPNLGRNVRVSLDDKGANLVYILACPTTFNSSSYSTCNKGKRKYVIAEFHVPYGVMFQQAIINSYYRTKHGVMLELVKHKKYLLSNKEEMIRMMLSR